LENSDCRLRVRHDVKASRRYEFLSRRWLAVTSSIAALAAAILNQIDVGVERLLGNGRSRIEQISVLEEAVVGYASLTGIADLNVDFFGAALRLMTKTNIDARLPVFGRLRDSDNTILPVLQRAPSRT